MFLVLPFFESLRIPEVIRQALCESRVPPKAGYTYTDNEVLMTLLLGFILKCKTFGEIHAALGEPKNYGVWIGKKRLPSIKRVQRRLKKMTTPILVNKLKELLTDSITQAGIVNLGVLYIDAHFITYYGKHNISKGYSTIRRLALRGTYHHFIGDRKGRPVMFYLTNGSLRLHRALPMLLKDIQRFRRKHQPNKPLFIVFDREVYDAKLFKRLDREQVVFITYMKNPPDCHDQNFTKRNTIDVQFRTKIAVYELFDTYTSITDYHDRVKTLVIRDPETGRKSTIITNCDRVTFHGKQIRPRNATLVGYMLNHWGQENFFKRALNELNIDHHFGYQIHVCSPQPKIDNPSVKELQKFLAKLKKELDKIQSQIAAFVLKEDKSISIEDLASSKPQLSQLLQKRLELVGDINLCQGRIDALPKKVIYTDAFPDKPKEECVLAKKDLLDTLKIMAFHTILLMADQFRQCHGDRRTLVPTLDKLIWQPADLILLEDKALVRIHPFYFPSIQSSAEIFCHNLNLRKIIHPLTGVPLHFEIGKR
jgi:hypothetical protein